MDPKNKFHSPLYVDHNEARFNHFCTLGLPIKGKSVLELGAGIGDHTAFLLSLGVKEICSVEARDENIAILNEQYGDAENVNIIKMDLEKPYSLGRKFDVIYSYGLLYHLSSPEIILQWVANHTKEYLILETCVSHIKENNITYVDEDKNNVTQSFSGKGCRPSRYWIMNKLEQIFKYAYIPKTQPVHPEFPVDWDNISDDGKLTRSIFIGSNVSIDDNIMLTKEI